MSGHGNETSVSARKTEESVQVKLVKKAKSQTEVVTAAMGNAVSGSSKIVQISASVPVEQVVTKLEVKKEPGLGENEAPEPEVWEAVAAGGSQVTVEEGFGSVTMVFRS